MAGRSITIGRERPGKRSMLLFPVQCLGRSCDRVFFGPGHLCERCLAHRGAATRAEVAAARRVSIRKRLGIG